MSDQLRSFLNSALEKFKVDGRIVGVAVAGSWITQTTDSYSDLDLVIVCTDEAYDSVLDDKFKIARGLGHYLSGFTGEHVGEPRRLLICLYDSPLLHVDLKFIVLSDLGHRIENPVVVWERQSLLTAAMGLSAPKHPMPDPQWIEDRFWVWVHYTAAKIGRGEIFEAIECLSFFRVWVLGPLSLVRHGQLPRGSRRLETLAPGDFEDLKKTVAGYDREECIRATRACVDLYRKLRDQMDQGGLIRRADAERAATAYLDSVV